jgi:hypothetical protein
VAELHLKSKLFELMGDAAINMDGMSGQRCIISLYRDFYNIGCDFQE